MDAQAVTLLEALQRLREAAHACGLTSNVNFHCSGALPESLRGAPREQFFTSKQRVYASYLLAPANIALGAAGARVIATVGVIDTAEADEKFEAAVIPFAPRGSLGDSGGA